MELPAKLLNAFFSAVTPRTAGYNSIDVGNMTQAGLFTHNRLDVHWGRFRTRQVEASR